MSHKGVDGRGRYGNEVGNSLRSKRDEPMGEEGGCKPEEHIRGGQGLAEGQPWQPLRAPGIQPSKGPKVPLHIYNIKLDKLDVLTKLNKLKVLIKLDKLEALLPTLEVLQKPAEPIIKYN